MAATPIEVVKLTNLITMFSGPGGNVVVWNEDGKVVVDTFVQGAFPGLKQRLDAMAVDELDRIHRSCSSLTRIGFSITPTITKAFAKRALKSSRMRTPDGACRSRTICSECTSIRRQPPRCRRRPLRNSTTSSSRYGAEEYIDLEYVPRAQTDTDIYVHFVMGDVLHLGGIFSNGMYPFIDADTGGSIDGMIAAAEDALKGVGNRGTKIVPGHGPVADGAALMRYRDMLVTVRDRVQKLKMAGRSEPEVVAAKPTADLDATWGQGFIQPEGFVSMVYKTL